jgi:hypothetical protein
MNGIESFSSSYYRLRMTLAPYEDGPVIDRALYDYIEREIYGSTDEQPLVRVGLDGGPHFVLGYENAVPAKHLAVPEQWIDSTDEENVFLAKPEIVPILRQGDRLSERFDDSGGGDAHG